MCDHCGCRSFPAVAELTAEHERILDLAWRLAESAPASAAPRIAITDELRSLLDRHAAKEELGLYPLLAATGDLSPETRNALEEEHVELHAALGGRFDRRDFYALGAHIEHEEMELFPAAMFAFDDSVWRELELIHRETDEDRRSA